MKFSQKIQNIEHSPIRKFHKYGERAVAQGKKIYHLNIGQPDILTPEVYYNAIKAFENPVLEYMPSQGITSLMEEMKKYYHRHQVMINAEDIIITSGGSEALSFALACLLDEGDEILMAEPFYTNYSTFIAVTGGKAVPITTYAEEGYAFSDQSRIEEKITQKTKAILITNPGNPTGTVLTKEELNIIAQVAIQHDLIIIADEVYREFVYDSDEILSFGQIKSIADRLIIIDSISKRFSACGARVGAIVCQNKEFVNNVMKLCQGRLSVATLDQIGATELYKLDPSYFDSIKEEYKKRRDIAFEAISKMEGVICEKPQGAFYLMAKLPIEDAEDFLIWLLTEFTVDGETVMYAPAQGFYETPGLGKNEIRIAYVLKEEDLKKAMNILKLGLIQYKKEKGC